MSSGAFPVIIAGGGPSGLATALMLKQRGVGEIIVVEKRSAESFTEAVAYTYLINGRGQRLTDLLGITGSISQVGIGMSEVKELHEFTPSGELKVKKMHRPPSLSENYFLPRDRLLDILKQKVSEVNASSETKHPIKLLYSTTILSIEKTIDGRLEVRLQNNSDTNAQPEILLTKFLIGCDGVQSTTRKFLQQHQVMNITCLSSPSVGLRFKMLKLNPNPSLPQYASDKFYTIVNNGTSTFNRFRLTFFPVRDLKDPNRPLIRTCANVCLAKHELWEQVTVDGLKQLFRNRFPQLNVSEFFSDEELERFVNDRGGVFPQIQYTDKVQATFTGTNISSHVVLLGDAAHCFPPDLGAGVNAALEDVFRLHSALEQCQGDLALALPVFESSAVPENRALCEIVQFAFPYQYRQSIFMFQMNLLNMAFRSILSKIMPPLFSPSAFGMTLNHKLPYSEIIRRAHATTRNIYLLCGVLVSACSYYFYRKRN